MAESLALLTDLYQVSMACGYWRAGVASRQAVFHLTFRRPPFGGSYAVCAGLAQVVEYLANLRFTQDDCDYLASLPGTDGKPMFPAEFIAYLAAMEPSLTVDAVPEGRVVFAHQPLLRVSGPILQAQLVETALLTAINFQTLIATKASRVAAAANGGPVLEFGLRRAQGFDGGLSASRAAFIGGCTATSNVLAGKRYGMPVRGTHAHSWVMFHGDELTAFREYAKALPNNCTFLVDTYDTLDGVRNAIVVGRELAAQGHKLVGIRLDSGDLAYLSQQARKLLDDAGFPEAKVVASNDLDEHLILSLRQQDAKIDVWGVGTKLVTAYDQPALGGVYKLGAVRNSDAADAPWRYELKLSEQPIKISNPGMLATRRMWLADQLVGDVIFDEEKPGGAAACTLETDQPMTMPAFDHQELLSVRVMDRGQLTSAASDATDIQRAKQRAQRDLAALSPRCRRFANPEPYWVGLDATLAATKRSLLTAARANITKRGSNTEGR